jgi:iron complex transport system substrate-binding protein
MRICSFLPGATEIVAELGLADHLVGISHECDFPPSVRHTPVMVEAVISQELAGSANIDRRVKTLVSSGQPLYRLNEQAFRSARPDVILIQDLCHVCAVTPDQLHHVLPSLPACPQVVTLNPTSLSDVVDDVERIGAALGVGSKGQELAQSLRRRIAAVHSRSATTQARPRVVCLEWLSPLYVGGHWVPEMVGLAGGQDLFGRINQPSHVISWDQVRTAGPDVVILMPCGFSIARTVTELRSLCRATEDWSHRLASWPKTYVVDAGSYFSRPGPRLVDGLELLAAIFSGTAQTQFDDSIVRDITGTSFAVSSFP